MIIVTDEAVSAATDAYGANPDPSARMRAAITAALPHLTDAGVPLTATGVTTYQRGFDDGARGANTGLDGQYFSDRLDGLSRIIQDEAARIVDHIAHAKVGNDDVDLGALRVAIASQTARLDAVIRRVIDLEHNAQTTNP